MTPKTTESAAQQLSTWLERINELDPSRVELGLARVSAVLPRLKLKTSPITITVAGTNGKGTSVHWLDAMLQGMSLRVGRYTSPHLSRFNERIAIDGTPIDDVTLVEAFEAVAAAQHGVELTYFEFTTLAALVVFAARKVDVQILEVGLGGRLDAVNAVIPDACLLTGVALDHQNWLGDTLEAIGREKAGIFRASIPAVVGMPDPPSSVLEVVDQVGADLWLAGQDFQVGNDTYKGRDRSVTLPAINDAVTRRLAAGCLAVLESLGLLVRLDQRTLFRALSQSLPGRLEQIAGLPPVLLDVAHNPQSIERLAKWLDRAPSDGGNTLVVGFMRDKPVAEMLHLLRDKVDRWIAVAADIERAMTDEALAAMIAENVGSPALVGGSPVAGLEIASRITPTNGRVVVAGSFPVVGAARAAL